MATLLERVLEAKKVVDSNEADLAALLEQAHVGSERMSLRMHNDGDITIYVGRDAVCINATEAQWLSNKLADFYLNHGF